MATRFIEEVDPTSDNSITTIVTALKNSAVGAVPLVVDADTGLLHSYDKVNTALRTFVNTDQAQTLTNKTLTAPIINAPSGVEAFTTISGDGAVAVARGVTLLTKGSAAAITLAAPGAAGIGAVLTITTGSDFAHVVTFTGGTLWDGTATANTTWTAAAVQGSSITVVGTTAVKWNVVSFNLGTIAP